MIRASIYFATVLLVLCSSGATNAVEIQNFKSGLVCADHIETPEIEVTINWICFETETIYVTGQGNCVYDGDEEQCTWYGFEFDYTNATVDDEITCTSTSVLPGNEGGPDGIRHEDITSIEWSLDLEPGDGHYYHPQYSVSGFSANQELIDTNTTVCFADGTEILLFRFMKIFPSIDKATLENSLKRTELR